MRYSTVLYALSNRMSRFTRTLNRYPTGTLIVGWTFRFTSKRSRKKCGRRLRRSKRRYLQREFVNTNPVVLMGF